VVVAAGDDCDALIRARLSGDAVDKTVIRGDAARPPAWQFALQGRSLARLAPDVVAQQPLFELLEKIVHNGHSSLFERHRFIPAMRRVPFKAKRNPVPAAGASASM
jgi:hypothetical protein